jgi:DNA-binding FadR family transcriptional regulator
MQPIRTTTVPAAVAEVLRRQITGGELRAGDRLPSNREFAAAFDVSMGSIREAISMLLSEGLITTRAGRGTYVAERATTSPMTAAGTWTGGLLEHRHLEELIEAREILELQLVTLTAQRASAVQIERIRTVFQRMQVSVTEPSSYSEADVEFHMAIAEAAGNRVLLEAMANIRALLRGELELSNAVGARRHGDLQFSVDSHRRVLDAIEAGDPERARSELFQIMRRNHDLLLSLYADTSSPESRREPNGLE